jgi:hypothetical protein
MGFFDNNKLIEIVSNYLKTQFEIIKLDIQERLEALLDRIFKFIITAFAFGIAALFALMGIANGLNEWLSSTYVGYLIIAGLSLLVGLVLVLSFRADQTEKNSVEEGIEDESDN